VAGVIGGAVLGAGYVASRRIDTLDRSKTAETKKDVGKQEV
jgi:hypothetical protein